MAWGRRCDLGCASWPDDPAYKVCPGCGEETTRFSNLKPLSQSEARRSSFDFYYEVYDAARSPDRLAPDAPDARCSFALVQKATSPSG